VDLAVHKAAPGPVGRLRLGRILAGLMPGEPEVHGLLALMEIQASRTRARTGPSGAPILLLDQDRRLWDRLLIRRGLAALERAEALGGAFGPYTLQAAIAARHARALATEDTDWERIAALYQVLAHIWPSPVVELNRAVAVGMAFGPVKGLEVVDALTGEPALKGYPQLPAVRGDLLAKLGRLDQARQEFERAATLTRNERDRCAKAYFRSSGFAPIHLMPSCSTSPTDRTGAREVAGSFTATAGAASRMARRAARPWTTPIHSRIRGVAGVGLFLPGRPPGPGPPPRGGDETIGHRGRPVRVAQWPAGHTERHD
jgi:hypothetical protein